MMDDPALVRTLYKKLVGFYPRQFREQLSESMEQTFHDLWTEKWKTGKSPVGFVFRAFIETAIGIVREHLLLVSPGVIMRATLKTFGSSMLISFLLILPLMIMEVLNRRQFNEGFPAVLFFVMWLSLFAISIILLPIAHGWRTGQPGMANTFSTHRNTPFTRPRTAAIASVIVFLFPGILPVLEFIGWLSLDRLFNGPNPEVTYLPGMFLALGLAFFPIAAGIIARRPVVTSLEAGGSLFAHPINLMIAVLISAIFAIAFINSLIDQWPCFIGVPNCD